MVDARVKEAFNSHALLVKKRLRDAERKDDNDDDGGAYPEFAHTKREHDSKRIKSGGTVVGQQLAISFDEDGKLDYSALYRDNDKKIIRGRPSDTLEKDILEKDKSLRKPTREEVEETSQRTKKSLQKIVEKRVSVAQNKKIVKDQAEPIFYKYKPAHKPPNGQGFDTRIIRITEAAVDPLEPPKFKHKKIPRPPPSPPPPVIHSPPRKVTAEEQKSWIVPPCISNWKNAKGYTIPLDKRLAADGRGAQEMSINDNFAKISEALFIADRHAREEVKLRTQMRNKMAMKEREEKESRLRALAQHAREENLSYYSSSAALKDMTGEELEKYMERCEIRKEKQMQREQQLRLSRIGAETRSRILDNDADRDISEKIALGLVKTTASKDALFDQRLFDRTQSYTTNYDDDSAYNIYDKPLFTGQTTSFSHNPSAISALDTSTNGGAVAEKIENYISNKKKAHFKDAEDFASKGPIKFEKSHADPFSLEEFMEKAKRDSGKSSR